MIVERPVPLMPDTNVYIASANGSLSLAMLVLLRQALLFHCAVCLSELSAGLANADPMHRQWPATRDHYSDLFARIPANRILSPDDQIWTEAGIVAGTLARTQGYQKHQRKECLNDALIFLTAAKAGLPVLTANRDEFDLIQQIVPEGKFIHF